MKYIFSLFFILPYISISNAQTPTSYIFGETMHYKNYEVDLFETTPDKQNYLVACLPTGAFKLNFKRHVLNKQLQIINTIDQDSIWIQHLFRFESDVYAMYFKHKREANRKRRIAKINPATFELEDERTSFEITSHKGPFYPQFLYGISRDRKKAMVLHKPYKPIGNKYKYHLYVYDDDFSMLLDKEFHLPEAEMDFSLKDAIIDNDGNVYLIGNKSVKKKYTIDGEKFEGITVKKITQSSTVTNYDLKLSNRKKVFVKDCKLVPTKHGFDLYMLESELDFMAEKIKNIVCVSLDYDLNEIHRIQHDTDNINFSNSTRKLKYQDLKIKEIVLLDNDHKLLVCEKQHEIIDQSGSAVSYEIGDIYAIKLDQKNEIIWASLVPKNQQAPYRHHPIGSEFFTKKNMAYVLFNDHEKNFDQTRENPKVYSGAGQKGVLKLVQLNLTTGEVSNSTVYNLNQKGIYGDLKNALKLDDGLLFLGSNQKGKLLVDYRSSPTFVKVRID